MTVAFPTERAFSLSAFEGLRLLRKYGQAQPDLSIAELVTLVEKVEADGRSLDLKASAYLSTIVESECPLEGQGFFQSCIRAVLIRHQPIWARSMRTGRTRFVAALGRDDLDVFQAAGLMDEPPTEEVVLWWDEVAGHARLIADQEKMRQGRAAEMLTIKREREKLDQLGIAKEPVWFGLDDNFAGYDVLSYERDGERIVNQMIEVKSSTQSPLRFYVTKNEWRQAEKVGAQYVFHVWDMDKEPAVLHVRTVEQVAPHIPTNVGKGSWSTAEIPVGIT